MMLSLKMASFIFIRILISYSLKQFLIEHFSNNSFAIICSNMYQWSEDLNLVCQMPQAKIIGTPIGISSHIDTYHSYIILEDNPTNVRETLLKHLRYKFNSRAKFLIILKENCTDKTLKSLFHTLWSSYIYNVVILYNLTNFVTWYPYHYKSLCGTKICLIKNPSIISIYANKIPTNLGGCPINVTWNNLSIIIKDPFSKNNTGYAVSFFNVIAEKINATLIYLKNNTDYFNLNYIKDSYIDLVQDMVSRNIDASFAVHNHFYRHHKELERTSPLEQSYQLFVFPPRKKTWHKDQLLKIISVHTIFLILLSILAMTLFWKFQTKSTFTSSGFVAFQMLVQGTIARKPKKWLTKTIFFIFITNTMILNSIYSSHINSLLIQPTYEPHIRKFADIIRLKKKIIISNFHKGSLKGYSNKTFNSLLKLRINKNPIYSDLYSEFLEKNEHGIVTSEFELLYRFTNPEDLEQVLHDKVHKYFT